MSPRDLRRVLAAELDRARAQLDSFYAAHDAGQTPPVVLRGVVRPDDDGDALRLDAAGFAFTWWGGAYADVRPLGAPEVCEVLDMLGPGEHRGHLLDGADDERRAALMERLRRAALAWLLDDEDGDPRADRAYAQREAFPAAVAAEHVRGRLREALAAAGGPVALDALADATLIPSYVLREQLDGAGAVVADAPGGVYRFTIGGRR